MNIIIIVLIIVLSSCSAESNSTRKPIHCKLGADLLRDHIDDMEKKGYQLEMSGGGMCGNIKLLSIGFYLNNSPTVAEARMIYVKSVESLLNSVNKNPDVRKYLDSFPFSTKNLQYTFSFPFLEVQKYQDFPIVYVSLIDGRILYRVNDPFTGSPNPLRTVYEESYEDALRIVNAE